MNDVLPTQAVPAAALDDAPPRRRWPWFAGAALVVALGVAAWLLLAPRAPAVAWRTEAVTTGDLVLTVTANGTLQPTHAVNIGSELSGTVASVFVDVNDAVRRGQPLVQLDTAKLNDQVQRSRAALAAAVAGVAQAEATRSEAAASLARLQEVARLSSGRVPAAAELDAAKAALARAAANLGNAHAQVDNARAALSTDATNLRKAAISAPIDGVVLSRNVEPGNAVAASLQAVTLLQLAEDLHHLRLQVNIDEADVGQVRPGQSARFTVAAWPNRQYPATLTRVAYRSTITDNVVTYVGYLDVDNADLSLRPGMTATATIQGAQHRQVLLVPNSALRFTPSAQAGAARSGIVARLLPRMPAQGERRVGAAEGGGARTVWVLRDGAPVAVPVRTGLSDGRHTEILGGALKPGMQVVTEQRSVP
ncbi:MAG: efflux RND transporter periplasmic adaptor subunit [Telluria sp.]